MPVSHHCLDPLRRDRQFRHRLGIDIAVSASDFSVQAMLASPPQSGSSW
jgi:hypothetical protein